MPKTKKPETLLPLTTPVFHILVALSDAERHGYGIMLDVSEQTGGALQLGPGTLYGCLNRMLAAGLVEESDERRDPDMDDSRRRYYRLSAGGRKAARAEARRLAQAVSAARSRRLLGRTGVIGVKSG
jgi:DNA-binding PadR family transcriptional regulator